MGKNGRFPSFIPSSVVGRLRWWGICGGVGGALTAVSAHRRTRETAVKKSAKIRPDPRHPRCHFPKQGLSRVWEGKRPFFLSNDS
ncbi:MAG: hypothetical protein KDE56_05415 [Anaerolineales bacterium]|nr:hypothetical protein [Anaerolineales bacterium]